MPVAAKDIIPLTKARARLTRLCEEVHQRGREMIITRNGESCAALIDSDRLDHYHDLETENIHLLLTEEAIRGVNDWKAGKTVSLTQLKKRYGRLSIKHHRQLSFDLGRFWGQRQVARDFG